MSTVVYVSCWKMLGTKDQLWYLPIIRKLNKKTHVWCGDTFWTRLFIANYMFASPIFVLILKLPGPQICSPSTSNLPQFVEFNCLAIFFIIFTMFLLIPSLHCVLFFFSPCDDFFTHYPYIYQLILPCMELSFLRLPDASFLTANILRHWWHAFWFHTLEKNIYIYIYIYIYI